MNTLYYFTGTGNSLQVAQDIGEKLGDSSLCKIADYNGEPISSDTLGIVFPVYDWGLPLVVVEFLRKLNISEGVYIYAAATYGALQGKALDQCKSMLEEKKRQLNAGFYVKMPGSNITIQNALSAEKQKVLFDKENEKVEYMAAQIKGRKKLDIEMGSAISRLLYNMLYKKMISSSHESDKNFTASSACVGCGHCVSNCPVKNISMPEGKPEWQHRCEMCMACIQSCPSKAIDFKGKTKGRIRYLNPNIK